MGAFADLLEEARPHLHAEDGKYLNFTWEPEAPEPRWRAEIRQPAREHEYPYGYIVRGRGLGRTGEEALRELVEGLRCST